MSDLYVDLKRRIPVVAEWTDIGTEEMERAQKRLGLSDEKLAGLLFISSKTWTRWKKRGKIPTHLLPRVAPVLGFEMVPLEAIPIAIPNSTAVVASPDLQEALATVVELVTRLAETMERCEDALDRIESAIRELPPQRVRGGQR